MIFIKKLTFFLLLFSSQMLFSQSVGERAEQAFLAHQALKYDQAIQAYESLIGEGYFSAGLYFNTAMAYYDNGNLGKAILFLEKAKRQAPYDTSISTNLELLQNEQEDGLLPLPTFFLKAWWNNMAARLVPNAWAILAILFSMVAAILFSLFVLNKMPQWRKIQLAASPVFLMLSILFFLLGQSREATLAKQNEAVITKSIVTIYVAPGDDADKDGKVHAGLKVELLDQFEGWTKIRLVDSREGWVKKEDLEVI